MMMMRDRESSRPAHVTGAGQAPLPPLLEQLKQHPYAALALGAGLGFAIARGPLSRVGSRVLAAGVRAAVPVILAPVAAALVQMVTALGAKDGEPTSREERRT